MASHLHNFMLVDPLGDRALKTFRYGGVSPIFLG